MQATVLFTEWPVTKLIVLPTKGFMGIMGILVIYKQHEVFTDLLDKLLMGSGVRQGVTDLVDMVFTSLQIRQGSGESETTETDLLTKQFNYK